ncbi:MAG: adenylate/guanylate cyclase domain-containing protein [Nocardioides sp.]
MPDSGLPFLDGEGDYTSAQIAERTGVSLEQAKKLWRALGFPEAGDAKMFTEEDVDALRRVNAVIESGLIDFDLSVALTRAMGLTMARLSDWEISALLQHLESRPEENGIDAVSRMFSSELSQNFEALMLYAWRRHLSASVTRVLASMAGDSDLHTTQLSVGFADIVSFTALSNRISEDRIGDLVELFESRCADVVANQRGRVIKSLGDSVLFVNDDPIRAYDTAEGIINVIGRDHRMPDVRVGLASGAVVTRMGDVFGPPVNMAARLTAVARRNRIIIDSATAELLPEDQFETRRLPARPVRGFGLVEPVAVRRV